MGVTQQGVDAVGLYPVLNVPAAVISGGISLYQGDYSGALLSVGSLVPLAGDAATALKIARNAKRLEGATHTAEEIFADTDLLVHAMKGNSHAVNELRQASKVYVTPNQYREFLAVSQSAQRRAFLKQNGIKVYGGQRARIAAGSAEFQEAFQAIVGSKGRGDASLAAFARATGITAVTADGKLFRYINGNSNRTLSRISNDIPLRHIRVK